MKLLVHILLPAALLFCGGCVKGRSGEGSRVRIDITVEAGAGNRTATEAGSAAENRIERIRVMVFSRSNGQLDTQAYDESAGGFETTPVVLNMRVLVERKVFCVIANEPAALTTTLDNITRLGDLTGLVIADENTYNAPGQPLPMTLYKEVAVSADRTDPISLSLLRAVGKVRMTIGKDPSNPHNVTLNSVQVVNNPVRSRLMPGNPVDPAAPGVLTGLAAQTVFTPDAVVTVATPLAIEPRYLYEHHWGTGDPAGGDATAMEIKVTMNGELRTFRFYLIGAYDNDGVPTYAVVRNTIADVAVTVAADGLYINYTVLPWEEMEEWEKNAGEDDGLFTVEQWVLPAIVEYEHELS